MSEFSKLRVLGGGIGALALAIGASWLAGAIFFVTLSADPSSARPWTFPYLIATVASNPAYHRAFVFSWVGGLLSFAVTLVGLVEALRIRQPLHGAARFARLPEIRRAGFLGGQGIVVGRFGRYYLHSAGNTHVIVSAPTRSGKGVGIVIPNLLSWPESTVTLDVKGENYALTSGYRASHGIECFYFNPVAEDRRTHRYNPLSVISDDPLQKINDIQKIASFLFPDIEGDAIWNPSARSLFVGVLLFIIETPGLPLSLGEVLRQVTRPEEAGAYFRRQIEERRDRGDSLSPICESALADFIATSTNTRTSIRKTFTARLELWFNPLVDAATAENDFDLRDLRRKPMSVYFGITPDNLERLAPLTNLFFQQAIDLNTRVLPEADASLQYKVLFVLDEFANFGRMNLVMRGISFIGGYGLRLLTILQSPAQLNAIYGEDHARTYMTNNAVKIHFKPADDRDAEQLSRSLGTQTVKSRSRSRQMGGRGGSSVSEADSARAVMLPQELRALDDRSCIIQADSLAHPIRAKKVRFYEERVFKERLRPPVPVPLMDVQMPSVVATALPPVPSAETDASLAEEDAANHLPVAAAARFAAALEEAGAGSVAGVEAAAEAAWQDLANVLFADASDVTTEGTEDVISATARFAQEHVVGDLPIEPEDGYGHPITTGIVRVRRKMP